MEENKNEQFGNTNFETQEEKFKSIDNEIESLYQLIDEVRGSSLAFIFEKLSNLADKVDEKFKVALQDKLFFAEDSTEEYRLEDAIYWFRENYTEGENICGGLFKMAKRKKGSELKIYHFFINETEKQVLTGKQYPLKLTKAKNLDQDLQNQFGDEDLILFR